MAKIKANYGEKWARVTPQRTQDYADGVQNPRNDWQKATVDGAANYAAGVQAAITAGSFQKGVNKAGNAKWQQKSVELGAPRFGQGVQNAQPDYEKGFAPYAAVISSLNLPPRYPKGDPRNLERVKAVSTALRNKKLQG